MQKNHFLLLKNFKNTESAQLWFYESYIIIIVNTSDLSLKTTRKSQVSQYFSSQEKDVAKPRPSLKRIFKKLPPTSAVASENVVNVQLDIDIVYDKQDILLPRKKASHYIVSCLL